VEEEADVAETVAGRSCFNGATAMKPWKSMDAKKKTRRPGRLQWGHGDEAVEEDVKNTVRFTRNMLQWGHGDEAVEE